jgi:hypothetical protein
MALLHHSAEAVKVIESITVSNDNRIISGNARYEVLQDVLGDVEPIVVETDGERPVILKRTDIESGTKKFHEAAILANTTAQKNIDLDIELMQEVLIDFEDVNIEELGVDLTDVDVDDVPSRRGQLRDRFIVPPFSILDTRTGEWQARKNVWIGTGIKSEEGRDSGLTYSLSSQPPHVYQVRNQLRAKNGTDPTWEEVYAYCQSKGIRTMGGTSIFDPVLCEIVYRWFNVAHGSILDPFSGGSVRGIVAAKLEHPYCGVDLRREQVEANLRNAGEVLGVDYAKHDYAPCWVCDDSKNIDSLFPRRKFDLLFSCPPYSDLEVYSDDPSDLSNMDYPAFLTAYREIIGKSCALLQDNRFAVFVVAEVRDKHGIYRNFVSDTIESFRSAGIQYYNDIILFNQYGSLPTRITRSFNSGRKIGKCHQNVLVFYKGDVKRIKENYPEIDFSGNELLNEIEND